jgi:hypothetical protein
VDLSDLAQDRNKWRVLLHTVMNHKMRGISWPASQRLYSMELESQITLSAVTRHFCPFASLANINRYSPISEPRWSCLCTAGALPTPTQRSWQWWWAGPHIRTEWAAVKETHSMHTDGKDSWNAAGY